GSERIVGLELDHRPDHHPEGSNSLLGEWELGQQLSSDALTGLVLREEIVAEGLDDVIEGTRHVRGARLGEEGEQTVEQAEGGADIAAVGSLFRRRSEEAAEELIGAVYQVDLHLCGSVGLYPL